MISPKSPVTPAFDKLTAALDEALALLSETAYVRVPIANDNDAPASLLQQCVELCEQHEAVVASEPIRTIHHFACTGGTLISKCIAAMPNTQLLSEVDPLSTMQAKAQKFAPTDIVTLMRQSTRGVSPELIIDLFLKNLKTIYLESVRLGQRLILRDHAHSHFCIGGEIPERPSFRQIVASNFELFSLVTVRHPIDSFLSLESMKWLHFSPKTFDEYCKRYIAFLHSYKGVPIIRYEDFVHAPNDIMNNVCELLKISFNEQFCDLFSVIKMTGDSGRKGNIIEPRARRPVTVQLSEEIEASENFQVLCEFLQYET